MTYISHLSLPLSCHFDLSPLLSFFLFLYSLLLYLSFNAPPQSHSPHPSTQSSLSRYWRSFRSIDGTVPYGSVPYRTDSEPTKAPNPNREKKKREREREREREEERKGGRGRRGWGRRKVFSWPSWLSDGAVYAYDVACVKLERRPCFMIFLKKIKT